MPFIDQAALFNRAHFNIAIGNAANANVTRAILGTLQCPSDSYANSGNKLFDPSRMGPNQRGHSVGDGQSGPKSLHTGGVHALMCDGSVRFISQNLDGGTMAKITAQGDEQFVWDF